jgi:hypothetical protein
VIQGNLWKKRRKYLEASYKTRMSDRVKGYEAAITLNNVAVKVLSHSPYNEQVTSASVQTLRDALIAMKTTVESDAEHVVNISDLLAKADERCATLGVDTVTTSVERASFPSSEGPSYRPVKTITLDQAHIFDSLGLSLKCHSERQNHYTVETNAIDSPTIIESMMRSLRQVPLMVEISTSVENRLSVDRSTLEYHTGIILYNLSIAQLEQYRQQFMNSDLPGPMSQTFSKKLEKVQKLFDIAYGMTVRFDKVEGFQLETTYMVILILNGMLFVRSLLQTDTSTIQAVNQEIQRLVLVVRNAYIINQLFHCHATAA